MRLLVLAAMAVGFNALAIDPPPMGFRVHIWDCPAVGAEVDRGYGVRIDQTERGTFASVRAHSRGNPAPVAEYKVNGANPTVARGHWVYVDEASYGRNFTLSISPTGQGSFHAVTKRTTLRGQVRCYRTRGQ